MLVVLDIDGTLADSSHRAHFLEQSPRDWVSFASPDLVIKDTPIPGSQRVVAKMQELRYHIVCLTARDESTRDVTMRWLFEKYNLDTDDTTLLMRPMGNMLNLVEYKAQAMQTLLSEYKTRGENSFIFVEDDSTVFETYAAEGLVLHAPGCWPLMFPTHVEPGDANV